MNRIIEKIPVVNPFGISTGVSTGAQRIITEDLFPNIYRLDAPDAIIDERFELYPNVYRTYGLPSTLTASVDPKYVTGPQKYEYKYVNNNGVEVILRGSYNDVMSTVDVLNTYPPLKKDCSNPEKREYVELFGPGSTKIPANVPEIGVKRSGKYIQITFDKKTYSGSGSLIMVVENGRPIEEAKIVLFRDSKSKEYQETGGMIDSPAPNTKIDKDILFNNAKKETQEESMKLFSLSKPSDLFVDVVSATDNTVYRVYLYLISVNNINQLSMMYDENRNVVLREYPSSFNESYRETDKLDLFDYRTFIRKLESYSIAGRDIASGTLQTVDGKLVNVRGRTLKVVTELQNSGKIADAINNKKILNTSKTPISGTVLFNSVNF